MHSGGCLCGGVRYELDAPIEGISLCHCRQCRKASGSAFVAVAVVNTAALRITAGEGLLTAYRATPGKQRVFCSRCGSPFFSARDGQPEVRRLRIGTLDTPLGEVAKVHAFTADCADWDEILDEHPRFPGFAR
ncbi:GFA family protein [Spiribacter halobius]|uniref:GFA family protein n=1 Tax=Sediminicurvatus halobius TaxID=2182432 RepID=A0A2U2N4H9_9GAMM|nr:GFA family protein [Spiribacter halobius]